mmetsp:Transcript_6106/g.19152  ORF Transcript_6106/g.19152 Transcript_6106/m.19152 type:complete len:396 (+) Transcript_6106:168-1355(+)
MVASLAASSAHGTRKKPEVDGSSELSRAAISPYELSSNVAAAMRARAVSSSAACIASSSALIVAAAARMSASGSGSFAESVRRDIFVSPEVRSRGPMSTRSGTPLRSHSKYLAPARKWSRASTCTRTPSASSAPRSSETAASTAAASAGSLAANGTITTCKGAMRGGKTRPASSECDMTRAPIRRVVIPQLVAHTCSRPLSLVWKRTSKAFAKFWPRKWEVPHCSAQPFCIKPSIVYVASAPAKRSDADFSPRTTGNARRDSHTSAYISRTSAASALASAAVACAVWPSCHRNSAERRKGRVRSSQRSTLAHWFTLSGRSRYDVIHLPNMCQMIVSDVGRTMSGSSSRASGSGSTPVPPGTARRRWCVTTAHSLAKPSTCSASFERKETGMRSGK